MEDIGCRIEDELCVCVREQVNGQNSAFNLGVCCGFRGSSGFGDAVRMKPDRELQ